MDESQREIAVSALLDDLRGLQDDKASSDVTFLVGPKNIKYHCHRVLLMSRCSSIRPQMLKNRKDYTFKYPRFDHQAFASVISFIYTAKIKLTDTIIAHVYHICTELGVSSLQVLCEGYLAESLNADNACVWLRQSLECGRRNVDCVELCKEYIADNLELCQQTRDWSRLPYDIQQELHRTHMTSVNVQQTMLFRDSEILKENWQSYQSVLNRWFGDESQSWQLLFRASTDGYTATSFHSHCDGHSPTFIIALGMTGSICGGYTDALWMSSKSKCGTYGKSNKSFIFTLTNKEDIPPTKFEVNKPSYAICNHAKFGPIFGGGADLLIADDCDRGLNCYSNMPHTYAGRQASSTILMGEYNFNVLDYEVFTLCNEKCIR